MMQRGAPFTVNAKSGLYFSVFLPPRDTAIVSRVSFAFI
jgi:hypothetical protein